MKKWLLILLLLCLSACAWAEEAPEADEPIIYHIADESELPEGWTDKELLRVTVLDVQRSDAILVQCGGENMMVDGGFGLYYRRVLRALDDRGVTEFKYLWNTHCDSDHSQGLKIIMNTDNYKGGELLSPNKKNYNDPDDDHEKLVRAADRHGWPYVQIKHGDEFTLGGAHLTTLQCPENWGQNSRSAVCRLVFGERSILLTGDIGGQAQKYFAQRDDAWLLDCDILKAPHHGVDHVVDAFVEKVTPEFVAITNFSGNSASKTWNAYDHLFAGDGIVVMETDGQVWYIWQLPNWLDKEMGT